MTVPVRIEAGWSRRVPVPEAQGPSRLRAAIADAVAGARHWPQWFTLGNLDIRVRFRRTGLGPFWTTLSFSLLLAALGLVYSRVLGEGIGTYLPWLALGLFVWSFAAATLQEGCEIFVQAEYVLKQLNIPKTSLLYRLLWRNVALLGFNLIAVAAVLALCRVPIGPAALLSLAGLLLLALNLAWASLLAAIATARFRGVSRLVQSVLPIAMLATPVIWRPEGPRLRGLAEWNPLYHLVQLVRGPLLGAAPPPAIWAAAAAAALVGGLAAFLVFAAARPRLTYWL